MKISIYATKESVKTEYSTKEFVECLNLSGRGKLVATIEGPGKPILKSPMHFGADMIRIDGVDWCIRDVVDMAREGRNGMSVA